MYENSLLFNRVIDNYPLGFKFLLNNMKRKIEDISYEDNRILIVELQNNHDIMEKIKENVYLDKSLKKLESLDSLEGKEYQETYNSIISVKEYSQ